MATEIRAALPRCSICKRLLDEPFEPLSRDCGGDCLQCMAEIAEDPDCIAVVQKLKETPVMPETTEPKNCAGCRFADFGNPEIGCPAACWLEGFFMPLPATRCAEFAEGTYR